MILVTGATGFLGREVVRGLVDAGLSVRALVHTPGRGARLSDLGVETVPGDVRRPETLASAMAGVETVVHLAAVFRETAGATFTEVNYRGTANVVRAAGEAGVRRLVVASVIGATSDPSSRYMYSRWMAEEELRRCGLPAAILRFSVLFGPGDEFLNMLAATVRAFPLVAVPGDGRSLLQPLHVEDAARCLVQACVSPRRETWTVELGGPDRYTYDQLVDLVADVMGVKVLKVHVPLPVMRVLAAVMEAALSRPPVTREQLKLLSVDNVADLDSVERAFGFAPRPLEGNVDYVRRVGYGDALRLLLGRPPAHVRDH